MGNACVKKKKKGPKNLGFLPLKSSHEHDSDLADPAIIAQPINENPQDSEVILASPSSNYPEFYTCPENIGVWIYSIDTQEIQFPEAIQTTIEADFITGKIQSEFTMAENQCVLVFKDSLMIMNENYYVVERRNGLRNSVYGWKADDGTVRPLIKEVEEILEVTAGKIKCNVNGVAYHIDIPKRYIIDIKTKVKRKIELL